MNNNKGRKYKQQGPQQKLQTHSQGQQAKDNEFRKEGETTQRQERREHKQQITERKEAKGLIILILVFL